MPPRVDFLAMVSRPTFASGSGPVGDYFALRALIGRHPEWNAAVIEFNSRPTEVEWDGRQLVIHQPGEPPVDPAEVGIALYLPICLEVEETTLAPARHERWPRFEAEQWRPVTALVEHRLDHARCINRPSRVRTANNKLLQYEALRAGGFDLPVTAVSRRFPTSGPLARQGHLVMKNLSEGGWRSETEFSPARLVDPHVPVDGWPVIWQEPLGSDTELRCYVMGDDTTFVELTRVRGQLDVRATNGGRPQAVIVEPREDWASMIVAMTRHLGLDYAVIDAIPVGDRLHVLEVNANGVWWFLPGEVAAVLERRFHRWIEDRVATWPTTQ